MAAKEGAKRPMKILLSMISLTKGKGGAERVATELANEMQRRGHEIIMYSSSTPDEKPQYPLDKNIRHIQIPLSRIAEVRDTLLAVNPDVFFIFYSTSHLLDQYAIFADTATPIGAQECTNPIRVIENFARRRDIQDLRTAFALRNALLAGMHGIRFTMDSYIDYLPEIAKPSCRTYNNTFRPAAARADIKKSTGRKRVISVGGLKTKNKNGVVLVRAFAEIASEFPDWDAYFFGTDNLPEAKDTIVRTGLHDRIVLAGSSDNIYAEYAKSQIHVITSFEEGCPNVVCEAMLHGIPSIGYSDCPGTNELIVNMKNGLLINRDKEVANLADALRRLMTDSDLREKLGEAAYTEATERFDSKKIYDRWENLFRHIAGYKDNPQKLFAEQCAIDPVAAEHSRRLRSLFAQDLAQDYLTQSPSPSGNEKVLFPASPKISIAIVDPINQESLDSLVENLSSAHYPEWEIILPDSLLDTRNLSNIIHCPPDNPAEISGDRLNGFLEKARGEYILFLNRDTGQVNPEALSRIVKTLEVYGSDLAHELDVNTKNSMWSLGELKVPAVNGVRIYNTSFIRKHHLRFDPHWRNPLEVFFFISRLLALDTLETKNTTRFAPTVPTNISLEALEEIETVSSDFVAQQNAPTLEQRRQLLILKSYIVTRIASMYEDTGKERPNENDIKKLTSIILKCRSGILALAKDYPDKATAIVAFASGEYSQVYQLVSRSKTLDNLLICTDSIFQFTEAELASFNKKDAHKISLWDRRMGFYRQFGRFLYNAYLSMPQPVQKNLHKIKMFKQIKEKFIG